MSVGLKSMSRKQLEKLQKDIDKKLAVLLKKELKEAQAKVQKIADDSGFSVAELIPVTGSQGKWKDNVHKFKKKAKNPTQPKYQNPVDGKTWTGHGRPPLWIVGNRAAFLITA
jgi:DNA-binding protein H-NS